MLKKKTLNYVATFVAGVGITAALYSSSNDSAQEAANHAAAQAPRPAATITKTAPAPKPKQVPTVTVTTTAAPAVTVPQSCLDALANAETGFGYAGEAMTAAGDFDVAGLNAANAKLRELAPTWNANKAACRASGGNR